MSRSVELVYVHPVVSPELLSDGELDAHLSFSVVILKNMAMGQCYCIKSCQSKSHTSFRERKLDNETCFFNSCNKLIGYRRDLT